MKDSAMFLKCSVEEQDGAELDKSSNTKGKVTRETGTKMTTSTTSIMTPRIHRKVLRAPSKIHPGKIHHLNYTGKLRHPGKGGYYSGKASNYSGKLSNSLGKPGNSNNLHSMKLSSVLAHSGKSSGKIGHYQGKAYHAHAERNNRGKGLTSSFHHPESACDNSNDSGLGLDLEIQSRNLLRSNNQKVQQVRDLASWNIVIDGGDVKHQNTNIKFDSDDAIDNFPFPQMATDNATTLAQPSTRLNVSEKLSMVCSPRVGRRPPCPAPTTPPTLSSQLLPQTRDGKANLQILCQPEQQHRARYQTEGSRGAVKDRSGNGFPVVKLVGYNKPTVLQVFIGTDVGRVAPHMFYQACRVSGKNSTPCTEKKVDGTVLIEIDLEPQKDWQVTCDCVGILKERNVDVEHRFGEQSGQRLKKKSTRCRMVFRTLITHDDGTLETIQISSQQIVCTQPPGVPEICKKSLVSCPANGGLELFLLGKNFLKDTRVVFKTLGDSSSTGSSAPIQIWEEQVLPDKEYLQQTHLVCGVPAYTNPNIQEPVPVKLFVTSGGKYSESHMFVYTPVSQSTGPQHATPHYSTHGILAGNVGRSSELKEESVPNSNTNSNGNSSSIGTWEDSEIGMMPPPALPARRPSLLPPLSPTSPPLNHFKTECSDESSQSSLVDNENTEMMPFRMNSFKVHNENSSDAENSMDCMRPIMRQLSSESQYNSLHMSDNSNMSMNSSVDVTRINENSSSMSILMHTENTSNSENANLVPFTQNPLLIPQIVSTNPIMMANSVTSTSEILTMSRQMSPEEIKVMDLRMKPPDIVATADQASLVNFKQFVDTQGKMQSSTVPVVDNFHMSGMDSKTVLSQDIEKSTSLETFSQQIEAIQKQNTDKVMESVAAVIFRSNTEAQNVNDLYTPENSAMKQMMSMAVCEVNDSCLAQHPQASHPMQDTNIPNAIMTGSLSDSQNKTNMIDFANTHVLNNPAAQIETLVSSPQMALSSNMILNPQMSPTLLCPQDGPLPTTQLLSQPLPTNDIMMMSSSQSSGSDSMSLMNALSPTVKTPPSAVKNMILNAAAEIFTSDSTMNALVTSAINTANILTNENVQNQPITDIHSQQTQQQVINGEYNFTQPTMLEKEDSVSESAVFNQAVTQAVNQAVSHAVSQAVSHAVNQEMKTSTTAPMQDLISMSDNDLLSYINPMLF